MGTYIIYNSILLFSAFFACFAEFSKTKQARIFSRIFLFIVLFIPSSIRYNIGTDYRNYVDYFYSVYGNDVNEIGFYILTVFLRDLHMPAHSLFVCSAFLAYFPLMFLSRKYYMFKIILYILLFYLQSFSAVRNMIALSFVILSFDLYFQKRKSEALALYSISLLFHLSSFVFLPFFFMNRLRCNRIVLLIVSLLILCISYFDFLFMLLNNDLFFETKYARYLFGKFSDEPNFNTGYGVLLKIVYTIFIFISFVFCKNENNAINYLFIFYLISLVLATKVIIMTRLVDVASVSLIFAIPLYLESCKGKYSVAIKYLTVLFYVACFELFIRANDGNTITGDYGIYPYQTILEK